MNTLQEEAKRRGRLYKYLNSLDDLRKIQNWPVFQQTLMLKGINENNNYYRWKIWHDMAMSGIQPALASQLMMTKDYVNGNIITWTNVPQKKILQLKQMEKDIVTGKFNVGNTNKFSYFDVIQGRVIEGHK